MLTECKILTLTVWNCATWPPGPDVLRARLTRATLVARAASGEPNPDIAIVLDAIHQGVAEFRASCAAHRER